MTRRDPAGALASIVVSTGGFDMVYLNRLSAGCDRRLLLTPQAQIRAGAMQPNHRSEISYRVAGPWTNAARNGSRASRRKPGRTIGRGYKFMEEGRRTPRFRLIGDARAARAAAGARRRAEAQMAGKTRPRIGPVRRRRTAWPHSSALAEARGATHLRARKREDEPIAISINFVAAWHDDGLRHDL
jgi:hypothetical protein